MWLTLLLVGLDGDDDTTGGDTTGEDTTGGDDDTTGRAVVVDPRRDIDEYVRDEVYYREALTLARRGSPRVL